MNELNARDWLIRRQLRTAQIIAGALVAGVVCFLGMVVFVLADQHPPLGPGEIPVISYAATAGFVGALIMSLIVPSVVVNQQVARIAAEPARPDSPDGGDTIRLLGSYQTRIIVADALLEGSAFFSSTAHMIERQPLTLAVACCAVALMLLTFPTPGRMESWLDVQQARVDQMRQFGGPPK